MILSYQVLTFIIKIKVDGLDLLCNPNRDILYKTLFELSMKMFWCTKKKAKQYYSTSCTSTSVTRMSPILKREFYTTSSAGLNMHTAVGISTRGMQEKACLFSFKET